MKRVCSPCKVHYELCAWSLINFLWSPPKPPRATQGVELSCCFNLRLVLQICCVTAEHQLSSALNNVITRLGLQPCYRPWGCTRTLYKGSKYANMLVFHRYNVYHGHQLSFSVLTLRISVKYISAAEADYGYEDTRVIQYKSSYCSLKEMSLK